MSEVVNDDPENSAQSKVGAAEPGWALSADVR